MILFLYPVAISKGTRNTIIFIKAYLTMIICRVLREIIECGINMFGDDFALRAAAQMTQLRPSSDHYMSKVRSTLKQIMRDWSSEGIVNITY